MFLGQGILLALLHRSLAHGLTRVACRQITAQEPAQVGSRTAAGIALLAAPIREPAPDAMGPLILELATLLGVHCPSLFGGAS